MREDEIKVNIKYEDDGKGKWQSVSARVEVDGDDYFFPAIAGFGETEKEAKKELKNKIIPLLAQVNKLFVAMDKSEQLEILKKHCRKFNPNTMIEFGAYVLYYTANPTTEMDIPSCVYEKVEEIYSKWRVRCENCKHYESHMKAIEEGKSGDAFCMLECNASHSAFEEKE